MNLLTANLTWIELCAAPASRDADAAPSIPADASERKSLRVSLCPYDDVAFRKPYGAVRVRGVKMLYDGCERIESGMLVLKDNARYRVQSVTRYRWMQACELVRL